MSIDLNCDMGEGMPNDAALMPFISSANIACGFHAGDDKTMRDAVALCLKHNVAIGAHPGFADWENFGRREMNLQDDELYELIQEQVKKLDTICKEMQTKLHHVKPHGALYNMAARSASMSKVIARAIKDFNPSLIIYGLSNSATIGEAKAAGLKTANEVFGDRTYQTDGSLTPRSQTNAMITDVDSCTKQVLEMITQGTVTTVDQKQIRISAQTLCIHGDGYYAVDFVKSIHASLTKKGITIKAIH